MPCVVHDGMAFVAGQIPMESGSVMHPGHLGDRVSIDDGAAAARQAALQALSVLRDTLHGFDRLERILQVTVLVAATPDFVDHPQVANGASELLLEVFGDAGRHARSAVGMAVLPLDTPVEVELIAEVA